MTSDEDRLGDLWAASLTMVAVDVASHSVVCRFSFPVEGDLSNSREMRLDGVSKVIVRLPVEDWDYAESTEIGLRHVAEGLELNIVLWDEPNEILINCRSIWLDDELIATSPEARGDPPR